MAEHGMWRGAGMPGRSMYGMPLCTTMELLHPQPLQPAQPSYTNLKALRHVLHDAVRRGAVGQDVQQVGSRHKVEAREGAPLGLHVIG